ncbi:MAG: hypothetical protein BWY74_03434 [Firmicutes bacterium ADurb.Bin419]|nr:MAG: hypothetical protein BWY74_03434 [Firmicutes bacterium ADurb.Bin419]
MEKLSKEDLVQMIRKIRNGEGSDEEFDKWLQEIKQSVSHPEVFNMIIRNTEGLNAEQIADQLMNYKTSEFSL